MRLLVLCVIFSVFVQGEGDGGGSYTPYKPVNFFFCETMTDDWEDRWTHAAATEAKMERGSGSKPSLEGDFGLLVPHEAKKYALSAPFETPFEFDTDFAVSYEVRYHKNLECGGAYLKLLSQIEGEEYEAEDLDGSTQYTVMFGPDKCGATNKVHFIFKHKNPISGEYVEHHLRAPPSVKNDRYSHVYTLIIRKDNTYDVLIDQESKKSGSLLDDFDPPVVPPKEIDDPHDEKPEDWVEEEMIPDPESVKPDDWDEDAPYTIPDPDATMPEGWLEDEPLEVPDPEAEKPEDWDDEFDGEFEAPLIDNPKCEEVGCGPWEAPEIDNPDYMGPWEPEYIENPDYIGEWEPKQIPNPNYFETDDPIKVFLPITAIGIEIWTMQDDVEFDNFYLGHDIDDMNIFIEKTYGVKKAAEEELMAGDEENEENEENDDSFLNRAGSFISDNVPPEFMELIAENPIYVTMATVILGLIPVLMIVCRSNDTKEDEEEGEEEQKDEGKSNDGDEDENGGDEGNDDSSGDDKEEDDQDDS